MDSAQPVRWPYLASAASAVIFGFSFLFTKNALDSLEMFQLLGWRFLVAALLLVILKMSGVIKVRLSREKITGLLWVALFQPVLYFSFETLGVDLTSASEAGIIISLIPIAVAFLAALILGERLNPVQWIAVVASVGGVVLLTLGGGQQGSVGHWRGIAALLGAVAAGSLYSIYSKKASHKSSPIEVTYVMMWVGAIVFNAIAVAKFALQGRPLAYFTGVASVQALTAVLYLALLSSVAAFFLMNYSLAKLNAAKSSVFINLTPVVSLFAGAFFRNERITPLQLLGAVIILAGVWGVSSVGKGFAKRKGNLPGNA